MAKAPKNTQFGTPEKVAATIERMRVIERTRATDRAKVNRLFNGGKPYTPEQEKKFQIQINVNWGEGKRIMLDANRQLNNALIHPGILFQCTPTEGALDKRDEWAMTFTQNIHRPMQEGISGKRHMFTLRARNATICMHGIGVLMWKNSFSWLARFVPLEDLLIETDTYCDFSNLNYFGCSLNLTRGELADMALTGEKILPGWNQDAVKEILDILETDQAMPNWRDKPEEAEQIFDQNKGYYYSDAEARVRMDVFYYRSIETKKWYRVILLREAIGNVGTDKFIFDGSKKPFADSIDHIINVQFGDGNLVAPLKYHSTRGLGVDLFAPVECLNRLRCEFVQHVFEQLKMYFKIQNPADRDRLKQIVLQQFATIPDGLSIVPKDQRHQIDANLVDEAMGQMRQIMQESSASFVQNANSNTKGGMMTAKEAQIRLNSATVMISGMLQNIYLQEAFYYTELVRRFCDPNSADEEVKEFQKRCVQSGIPKEMLDAKKWKVTPERVLGGGDRSMAQMQAEWMNQNKNDLDPASQITAKRKIWGTMLEDFSLANQLIPKSPVTSTPGSQMAEQLFGTLMTGNPVAIRTGIDEIGYVSKMLEMMGAVIIQIQSIDNMGTMQELAGLSTVAHDIAQHIQIVAARPAQKSQAKQFSDVLGKLINELKGFSQRIQQKKQASDLKESMTINFKDLNGDTKNTVLQLIGLPPSQEQDNVAQAKTAQAVQQIQLTGARHQQEMQHSQQRFASEQDRLNAETAASLQRKNFETQHAIATDKMKAAADILIKAQNGQNNGGQSSKVE